MRLLPPIRVERRADMCVHTPQPEDEACGFNCERHGPRYEATHC